VEIYFDIYDQYALSVASNSPIRKTRAKNEKNLNNLSTLDSN
jgi:hypothetical protein